MRLIALFTLATVATPTFAQQAVIETASLETSRGTVARMSSDSDYEAAVKRHAAEVEAHKAAVAKWEAAQARKKRPSWQEESAAARESFQRYGGVANRR